MVARLTPDQKVACSTHVGVMVTSFQTISAMAITNDLVGKHVQLTEIAVSNYVDRFRSVVVITSALHAEGPRFEPERNHYTECKQLVQSHVSFKNGIVESSQFTSRVRFRSVVVITCASHAQGPRFEPERNHLPFFILFFQ